MSEPAFEPLSGHRTYPPAEMAARARAFRDELARRRTVRAFSDRPVATSVLEACLEAAGSAPSGANLQPWHFVVVRDPDIKHRIRVAAEEAERAFYAHRAPPEWLAALAPLGTDAHKPFLEEAPVLIAVFAERYAIADDGRKLKRYYVDESVGLACGFLVAALHHAGLATLTHTPSPMGFLREVLGRPENERPFLLLVVGHPASGAQVPRVRRKPLDEITTFVG
jgi:nitroreductase